jgi:hypothetical protein
MTFPDKLKPSAVESDTAKRRKDNALLSLPVFNQSRITVFNPFDNQLMPDAMT